MCGGVLQGAQLGRDVVQLGLLLGQLIGDGVVLPILGLGLLALLIVIHGQLLQGLKNILDLILGRIILSLMNARKKNQLRFLLGEERAFLMLTWILLISLVRVS